MVGIRLCQRCELQTDHKIVMSLINVYITGYMWDMELYEVDHRYGANIGMNLSLNTE